MLFKTIPHFAFKTMLFKLTFATNVLLRQYRLKTVHFSLISGINIVNVSYIFSTLYFRLTDRLCDSLFNEENGLLEIIREIAVEIDSLIVSYATDRNI
jgi:hypothetical protein